MKTTRFSLGSSRSAGFCPAVLAPGQRRRRSQAMTLVEILVAVAILSIILIGLFKAFQTTSDAFNLSRSQTDVLEGGRAGVQLIISDLQEAAPAEVPAARNFVSETYPGGIVMPRVDGSQLHNVMQDFFFLTRHNDVWKGVGYYVLVRQDGVGTLYRFTESVTNPVPADFDRLWNAYTAARQNLTAVPVIEGIVHLRVVPYDGEGLVYDPAFLTNNLDIQVVWHDQEGGFTTHFFRGEVPAFVDVEVGLLEPGAYKLYQAREGAAAAKFLSEQVGKVHLFRQRVPVLNRGSRAR